MASTTTTPPPPPPPLQSAFLGQNKLISSKALKPYYSPFPNQARRRLQPSPCAKLNLSELMGGRGLCNGERGIQQELQRPLEKQQTFSTTCTTTQDDDNSKSTDMLPLDGFEKELMGLTGGFPGGEKGLKQFILQNPPPKKPSFSDSDKLLQLVATKKATPPELPLLLPGMIAIVKNPNSPYYMYCGIVQRITDGKVGVLFEGGNWDRLITFRAEELERREKGPPGKNPRSVVIEEFYHKASS